MKWYVIRWVTVLMLVGSPIKFAHAQGAEGKPFSAANVIAMPVSHDSDTYMLSMRHWRMTVYICGAYLGREIVQRRKLARRRRQLFSRKKHRSKQRKVVQTRSRIDRERIARYLLSSRAEMKAKQETRCRAVKDILLDRDNPPVNG